MSLYHRVVLQESAVNIGMGRLTKSFKQVVSDLSGKTWIVFDTETTGFKPTPTTMITELAAVAIDIDSGKKVGEYHAKAKLTKEVKALLKQQAAGKKKPERGKTVADIFKMTRYGDKNTAFKPLIEVVNGFRDFVEKYQNVVLVAHNAKFDMMQVNVALKKLGQPKLPKRKVYDTVSMARIYVYPLARVLQKAGDPHAQKMVDAFFSGGKFSARLENIGKVFGVKADHWHSGISDTLQLARILWKMVSFFKKHSSLDGEELLSQFMRQAAAREWSRQWYFKAGKQWREKRGMA